jgi:hypothetical protein
VKGTPTDKKWERSYTFRAAGKMPLGSSDRRICFATSPSFQRERERKNKAQEMKYFPTFDSSIVDIT